VYDNAQRLQPTPKPTEILYAILFHDNTSANGNTLYHIVPHRHHRWHTCTSYLFLTDGVTVPSPSPFPYTRKPISHANKPTWLPVALRLGRGMHAVQPSFWGEALPKIHKVGLSIPPAQNTYGGGRTLPYPNLWPSADPLPGGSSGAIAHPPRWGSRGAIAHPQPKRSSGAIAHPQPRGKLWSHCPSQLTLWGPKPTNGQLTPNWPIWCNSAPPILGPWASDLKRAQMWRGAILNPPILGPSGVTCPFYVFRP